MKYFIYCRKSSENEDRQVLSLPGQEKELREYAQKENLNIVCLYKESKSAHWAGRPGFNEMLERIKKGEGNGIIVWDESRIARNAKDSGDVIYMIDLKQIVEIRKLGKIYRNTPDDKSWLAMCFMMSKKESDDKGVNTKRGLKTKAEMGWFPSSWTKPGYMWDRFSERGNKTMLNDPVRFPLIKKTWEKMLTGAYSVPQILRLLNNDWGYRTPIRKSIGGKPMQRSQLYEVFADTFYYGEYEYPEGSGNWYKGKHEPMIAKEEFDRVQILLGRKGRHRPQKHNFPLTGIIRCGACGAMVTAEEKWQIICPSCKHKFASKDKDACPNCKIPITKMVKPTILHYNYYHCTKKVNPKCTQKSIAADKLEKQVDEVLKSIGISELFKQWAIKHLNQLNEEEVTHHTAAISSLQNAYNDCIKRLDNLVKLKISPQNSDGSLLSDDEFKSQKTAIMQEKISLEDKLKRVGQRVNNWVETAEKTFDFALHARYKFMTGSPDEKREILATIGSNLTLLNKVLRPDLKKEYCFIEEVIKTDSTTSGEFEPEKRGITSLQLETSWSQNLSLLPIPQHIITLHTAIDYSKIIQTFQNLCYIGELRQRWEEIKRLQTPLQPAITT